MDDGDGWTRTRATRVYASTLGILVGLAGIDHGLFEVLQGNASPDGLLIDAIGSAQRYWEYGTETALTVVPSFLVSGILSTIIGLLVVIWAYGFVGRRYGAVVLLALSVALFLVGGGFAPIFLTGLAFIGATRIGKPSKFWRSRVPAGVGGLVAGIWPWSLILGTLLFVISVEIAIFGYPLLGELGPEATFSVQTYLGWATLVLSIVSLPAANAYDARRMEDRER